MDGIRIEYDVDAAIFEVCCSDAPAEEFRLSWIAVDTIYGSVVCY